MELMAFLPALRVAPLLCLLLLFPRLPSAFTTPKVNVNLFGAHGNKITSILGAIPPTGPEGQPAKNQEEDLELTRQIIMAHIEKYHSGDVLPDDEEREVVIEKNEEEKQISGTDTPENDLMIRAALGEYVEKTPVWLFRQAGRHLPEYKEYKDKVGRSFLEMLSYPDDVAECTMQPLRRYDVDAAILFSDILVIAEAINIPVTMPGGVGILVPEPLRDPEDMSARIPSIDSVGKDFVLEKLGYVMESVKKIREKMREEDKSIPLIGFSAAPWTLLFYIVGGSSKRNTENGVMWLEKYPNESRQLLDLLTKIVIEYCACQVEAGCHMVQVFEAMGMMIDRVNFDEYALPCLREISTELKRRFPNTPLMVFSRGASFANEELAEMEYDVVTIDGSVPRNTARKSVDNRAGLQGNYDPRELIDDGTKTPDTVRKTAKEMLLELGPQRLIANLGEGLGGKESPELVKVFVDAIHEESEALIKGDFILHLKMVQEDVSLL